MSYYDELLNFCSKHKELYCFGAGDYGMKVLLLLKKYGFCPNAFLISEGEMRELDGIPIYALGSEKLQISSEAGVILSLHEKHHTEIIYNLHQRGINDIFEITSNDIYFQVTKEISDIYLFNDFMSERSNKEYIVSDFEKRAEKILERYSVVELQYIYLKQIGGMLFWIYNCQLRNQDNSDKYYLYYPMSGHKDNSSLNNMPNNFLMKKLKGDGIEVINSDTLGFWQYFAKNYRDRLHVNNGYSELFSSDNFNQFVTDGKLIVDQKYIEFNKPEIEEGNQILGKLGINDYICIATRESAYRRDVMEYTGIMQDIADIYRNSDIDNFELTAQYLEKLNISAVRMGAKVEKEVKNGSKIIDYASKMRSDFADVYLFSKCMFLVSDSSGMQVLPKLFAKPIITINQPVFTTMHDFVLPSHETYDLMIIQKYWDSKKERYLTFREMIELEVNGEKEDIYFSRPANTYLLCHKRGIIPIKNTPEEILDVVKEMLLRINGEIVYDELDLALKDKFDSIKNEYMEKGNYFFNMRIGREFLRQNQWLLD